MSGDGIRLLRELSVALDAAARGAEVLTAAVRVLVPAFADAAVVRVGEGSGQLVASGPIAPAPGDRPLELALIHRGEKVGGLHLVRRAAGRADWTEDERMLAEECAARIAVALEDRRLAESSATATLYDGFLATLSHELRTPLNVIIGWVDLLKGERLTFEKRSQALEIVERNARMQIRLIEDILEASRIVSGRMRLELSSLPALDVVIGAVEGMRPQAEAARITLDTVAGPAFTLRGDAVRLGQVVTNLVGNALRYTPPGGRVEVALARQGDAAVLTVTDDGSGIDPSFLPHVFERFRQGERKRSAGGRGLGLGLFIVRHIVELHGGTVSADSEGRGRGSRFTVRLPL